MSAIKDYIIEQKQIKDRECFSLKDALHDIYIDPIKVSSLHTDICFNHDLKMSINMNKKYGKFEPVDDVMDCIC